MSLKWKYASIPSYNPVVWHSGTGFRQDNYQETEMSPVSHERSNVIVEMKWSEQYVVEQTGCGLNEPCQEQILQ